MNITGRTASKATLAFCAAALGATGLTFGTGGQSSNGPVIQVTAVESTKADRLCGSDHWPPTESPCLQSVMAKSGRSASVRLAGTATTVVERPLTDRERLEAAFAAFETQTKLARRM